MNIMKRLVTLFVMVCGMHAMIAQSDVVDNAAISVATTDRQMTAELVALYEESRALENTGTAFEIEANRLAIKAAWETVDPAIAALYKPIDTGTLLPETMENLPINGIYYPEEIKEPRSSEGTRDWDTDRLLLDEFVDGVDMDVTGSGHIYIAAYQNNIDFGGMFDIIYIYRSLDGGQSFEQWQAANVTAPVRKLQLVSIHGTGDEYMLAYLTTASGNFQAWRWNTSTGAFDAQVVSGDVSDFGVDRNFPTNTNGQRVFAIYQKDTTCDEVHSARSTSGSYGFDWVDEISIDNVCGAQTEMAYGFNGSVYTTYTGASTGNLYVNVNSNYNDPASWDPRETLTTGAVEESLNPTIKAARKELATDEVMVVTSQRDAGATNGYRFKLYTRENGAAFTTLFDGVPLANQSSVQPEMWIRKGNVGTNDIQIAHVFEILDASSSNFIASRTYEGAGFPTGETISDTDVDVFEGFPPAVAETDDDLPCMAFAGTSGGGTFGFGLYFDAKTVIVLNTAENALKGVSYYPNPMQTEIHVQANQTIERVELYSITGAKVLEQTEGVATRATINTASLTAGVYLLRVLTGNQVGTYRVIKQ